MYYYCISFEPTAFTLEVLLQQARCGLHRDRGALRVPELWLLGGGQLTGRPSGKRPLRLRLETKRIGASPNQRLRTQVLMLSLAASRGDVRKQLGLSSYLPSDWD